MSDLVRDWCARGLVLLGVTLAIGACARTATVQQEAPPNPNVLLVTIDTLRADRLGAYGYEVATPAMDELAASGTRFDAAYATAPLTLPSHTSLLTGTYPALNGIRDNAAGAVPDSLTTLPEALSGRGYRTGAFVSAFVLDGRWGLDQGFDEYYDDFDTGGATRVTAGGGEAGLERRGGETVDAALAWLGEAGDEPFFAWVHLFDPHAPYQAPEPYARRFPDNPYDAEIAYVDAQVGRLLEYLDGADLRDGTVVILAADHGEALGEHGEVQHGLFVYEETIRVPLIVAGPGLPVGAVHSSPVSLVDVAPTVADLVGSTQFDGVEGHALFPLEEAGNERVVYAESLYGRLHYGWSELRAVIGSRYKLIDSSDPELFDLVTDPDEHVNALDQHNSVYSTMKGDLEAFDAVWDARRVTAAAAAGPDADALARLRALGYVTGAVETADGVDLPTPRSRIDLYNKILTARSALNAGDLLAAEQLIREAVEADSAVLEAQRMFGEILARQGRHLEAAEVYRAAVVLQPTDPESHLLLSDTLTAARDLPGAERALEAAREFVPPDLDIEVALGATRAMQGDLAGAATAFESALALDNTSAHAHSGLAQVYMGMAREADAVGHARAALDIDPVMPRANYILAEAARRSGDIGAAVGRYEAEIRNDPRNVLARFNLAMSYRELGRDEESFEVLTDLVAQAPGFAPGSLMMGRALLERGELLTDAGRLIEGALPGLPAPAQRVMAFEMLAEIARRNGDADAAARWAAAAAGVRPGPG